MSIFIQLQKYNYSINCQEEICSASLAKDQQTIENYEQKSSKPYRQLVLSGSGDCFCSEKMGKSIKKITSNKNPFSPHHPQNHLRRHGHFSDGTKACTDVHEVPKWHFKLSGFSFVKFRYTRLRFELIRVFRPSPCEFIEKL